MWGPTERRHRGNETCRTLNVRRRYSPKNVKNKAVDGGKNGGFSFTLAAFRGLKVNGGSEHASFCTCLLLGGRPVVRSG